MAKKRKASEAVAEPAAAAVAEAPAASSSGVVGDYSAVVRKTTHKKKKVMVVENDVEFTEAEWSEIGIKNLHIDHFIKLGDSYFQPSTASDGEGGEGVLQLATVAAEGQSVTRIVNSASVALTFEGCSQRVLPWRPPIVGWDKQLIREVCKHPDLSDFDERLGRGHGKTTIQIVMNFVEAIQKGTQPSVDLMSALDMTLPGIAGLQSVASGTWESVPDPRTWV